MIIIMLILVIIITIILILVFSKNMTCSVSQLTDESVVLQYFDVLPP